jgi:hypothetical protein
MGSKSDISKVWIPNHLSGVGGREMMRAEHILNSICWTEPSGGEVAIRCLDRSSNRGIFVDPIVAAWKLELADLAMLVRSLSYFDFIL